MESLILITNKKMKVEFECLDCKHSVFEPDGGYGCELKRWGYFPKRYWECPDFLFDEDYVRKQFENKIRNIKG